MPDSGGYELPGENGRQDEPSFERWLIERNLAGPDRLSVSVLVIREHLDAAGLIRECVLERRRGGIEGPYYGNVARIEFTGAAARVRRYRAARDGRLTRLRAEDDIGVAPSPQDIDADAFAGEDAAVHAYFGCGTVILDRRTPSLFEDLAALSVIIHARRNGAVFGCGVGWHGAAAFVLAADFPRDEQAIDAPPDLGAAVARAVEAQGFIPRETREDEDGFGVIAQEAGSAALVIIRMEGTTSRIAPYVPGRIATASEDQRRWMTYAETYEGRTVVDSWRTGDADDIAVVTIDQDREAWRHIIDADGVEVSRRPDNEAAAAVLYRERAGDPMRDSPGETMRGSAAGAEAGLGDAAELAQIWVAAAADETVPPDSLLSSVLAWSRIMDLLGEAHAEARAAGGGPGVARGALDRLSEMEAPLAALNAGFTAGSLARLLTGARTGAITKDGFEVALQELGARLRDELALTRIVTVPNGSADIDSAPLFGPLVEIHFPAATYDIEEAFRCLSLRRPTAGVLHAMKVMRHGLEELSRLLATRPLADLSWSRLLAAVRAAPGHQQDLIAPLVRVRRAWRAPGLMAAEKYTEEEATAVLNAVAAFMRALAARFDTPGEDSNN